MINVDAVILAAGRSSRMGSVNKVQAVLAGKSLLNHVIDRLAPQVDQMVINGDAGVCGDSGYVLVEDAFDGFQGPLMGLYSALNSEGNLGQATYLMMVPCDGPFIPSNLVAELYQQIVEQDADVACIRYQDFAQPTFSLWHKRVAPAVKEAMLVEKYGGFKPLLADLNTVYLDWPEQSISPFFNINTVDDLAEAEGLLCR
jgi:molybdopterin-guanine dinucleotide biosynthesis protein A